MAEQTEKVKTPKYQAVNTPLYAEIENFCLTTIGHPVNPLTDVESTLLTRAIVSATSDYWISYPYVFKEVLGGITPAQDFNVTYDEVKNRCFNDNNEAKNKSILNGVLRVLETKGIYSASVLESRLASGDSTYVRNPRRDYRVYPPHRPDFRLVASAIQDRVNPETIFLNDPVNERFVFSKLPSDSDSMEIWWAFGFEISIDDMTTMKYISNVHRQTYKRMVLLSFCDAMISARQMLETESDFTINMGSLENIVSTLREEISMILKKTPYTFPVIA